MKQVGIVNMYGNNYQCRYLINAIISLGYKPLIIDYSQTQVLNYIKSSPIQCWIFSGAAHTVFTEESPQIPLQVANLKTKKILLICYSMESLLYQLGAPITTRNENKKEIFNLLISQANPIFNNIKNPMVLRRNHIRYVAENHKLKGVALMASYEGEQMIAAYKNATMMQFHPEKTPDGKKLLLNWLQGQ